MTKLTAVLKRARRVQLVILVPVLLLISLGAWALSSPIGSSPDDDFHLTSIWCGAGDRADVCESVSGEPAERRVPAIVLGAADCYKAHPDTGAACQSAEFEDTDQLVQTDRGNFEGLYPPVYYAAMAPFVGDDVYGSVLTMRIVNVVVFLVISTALFVLLPVRRRPTLALAWLISLVPLSAFLIASTNPSGWAVMSAGTVWLALLGYFETTRWRAAALAGIAALGVVMGAGSRADSAVYSGIAVVVAAILAFDGRERSYWIKSLLPVALGVLALVFYFSANQANAVATGLTGHSTPADASFTELLLTNLREVPELWAGVFGFWGLGWLDTVMPAAVWVGAGSAFVALVFAGFISMNWRKAIALGIVFLALLLFPSWILVQSQTFVGREVQPRYILPLIVMFGGIALLQLGRQFMRLGVAQWIVLGTVLVLANALALHANMRRYITGQSELDWNLNHYVNWWWSSSPSPMIVWLLGVIAFAGAVALLVRHLALADRLSEHAAGPSRAPSSVNEEINV